MAFLVFKVAFKVNDDLEFQIGGLCSLCKPILSYLYRCFGHFRQLRLIFRRKKPHVNLRVPQVKSEQMWHTRIIHILEGGRCRHDHYHRCHHHNHGGRQAGRQAQLTPTTQFCPKSLLPPSLLLTYLPPSTLFHYLCAALPPPPPQLQPPPLLLSSLLAPPPTETCRSSLRCVSVQCSQATAPAAGLSPALLPPSFLDRSSRFRC